MPFCLRCITDRERSNICVYAVRGGNIYGFTGHNGSGKTMLIRAICGLMKLSEGSIVFSDKADIGLLIENIGLYPDLSAFDNLKLLAKIRKKDIL